MGECLAVTRGDDVFAEFVELALQQGLENIEPRAREDAPWQSFTIRDQSLRAFRSVERLVSLSPAERFSRDLPAILALKPRLTRRQWTVLLESLLRLGLGMHVLWTCDANVLAWEMALSVASGHPAPVEAEIETALWGQSDSRPLLELGTDAKAPIERLVEQYAYARTGLNLLLCRLDDVGASWPEDQVIGFTTRSGIRAPAALASFLEHVATHRLQIDPSSAGWLRTETARLFDEHDKLRELAGGDSGYTKNLFEFARHSLGQIEAKDPERRCYDLAYLLAYMGDRRKSLPVQPGPDTLVMLVHACCMANWPIPVSLDDFRSHLGEYGIHVPAGELINGKTGRDLAMLGLVVDSPDAAGGRLLVPPF
jgi:hypothetical protein